MILVRNVFRLKYGQARPAVAAWKAARDLMRRAGFKHEPRVMTDLVGPSYTLVMEITHASLDEFEKESHSVMANEEWKKWYQTFVPLVESGYREIFTLID
jgi:hypothetical protein